MVYQTMTVILHVWCHGSETLSLCGGKKMNHTKDIAVLPLVFLVVSAILQTVGAGIRYHFEVMLSQSSGERTSIPWTLII